MSRVCSIQDWDDAAFGELMTEILPSVHRLPHRKAWEFALGVRALRAAGVLNDEATGLSVGAGHTTLEELRACESVAGRWYWQTLASLPITFHAGWRNAVPGHWKSAGA